MGGDLYQRKHMTKEEWLRQRQVFDRVLYTLRQLSRPIIAAVHGMAYGGGCEIAICTDFIIASDEAVFGQPEAMVGLSAGGGSPVFLPRVLPPGRAMQMLLTGDPITAQEAHRLGMVNEVHPKTELMDPSTRHRGEDRRELADGGAVSQACRADGAGRDGRAGHRDHDGSPLALGSPPRPRGGHPRLHRGPRADVSRSRVLTRGKHVSQDTSTIRKRPTALVRTVPIIGWLPKYQMSWLGLDLLAGLSVWALVVPQALAYANVVGVPAQYGLYTILGASVLYAVFASTHQVVTGPSASVAAVTAPVAALYVASTSPDYLSTVIALTMAVGVVYVVLGALRMGWVSNFLAKAVLEGFIFAVGFGLIVDQLPKILGVEKVEGSYWDVLVGVLRAPRSHQRRHAGGRRGGGRSPAGDALRGSEAPPFVHRRVPGDHSRSLCWI